MEGDARSLAPVHGVERAECTYPGVAAVSTSEVIKAAGSVSLLMGSPAHPPGGRPEAFGWDPRAAAQRPFAQQPPASQDSYYLSHSFA